MEFLTTLFIFLLVLFLYLHITYQYKRSEDLEIYELDYTNNAYIQEVCDVKQPVLFPFQPINEELFAHLREPLPGITDVNVKDMNDYYVKEKPSDSVALPLESSRKLFRNDAESHYFTENNHEFVEETFPLIKEMDDYLKPPLTVHTKYDYSTGSKNSSTPLRYHTHFRQFYLVTQGKISVKMTPFKSSKYLHPHTDYETLEHRSPIHVWTPQAKYTNEMDKIPFLAFDVLEGSILYVPPYWWYSIKYADDESVMVGFTYCSVMNVLANAPDYMKYYFQQQNTQTKTILSIEKEGAFDSLMNLGETKEITAEKEIKTM